MHKTECNTDIIIVTGAESTGKTALAQKLAAHYKVEWVPELARTYIENLNRHYTYHDVEQIARMQIEQFHMQMSSKNGKVIFDTGLIITKVWFDVVYNKCPDWLIDAIEKLPRFFHLLCDTDLDWQPDPVRENGGAMREKLMDLYKQELTNFNFPYKVVSGIGETRFKNALAILKDYDCRIMIRNQKSD